MAQDAAFQKQVQRIGELVERLEATADPNARALAKELVESLMALHGAALERILEIAAGSNDGDAAGDAIIQKCAHDELVSSVLLLYGLHPEDLNTRVANALDKKRGFLESHTASVELVSIGADGTVTVRLHVKASGGCGSTASLVKSTIEGAIQDAAPDAAAVVVEESGVALKSAGFVPVTQLMGGGPGILASSATPQAARSGD
jgi:Fe-S cluster biogenesis protein NfuA